MPPKKDPVKPKRIFFNYKEEDVLKAIEEIGKGAQIRKTCRKYNIPHTTIINKMKLKHPVPRKMGPPTILTPQEESLLKSWIMAMAKKGFPVNKGMVLETVQRIIKEDNRPNPFTDDKPGRKWFASFLKRHQDISVRHAESINVARSLVTENALRKWHANLKEYLVSEGISDILEDPERIINADESGFQTSPSTGLVLGPRGFNNLYEIKEKEKESITVLGTFSASGTILPPLIIYPYERIPSEIVRQVNKEWAVGKSEKGWMTSRVFYGYIANTLIPKLKENEVKFPVLLLIDGHKSHINQEVSQLCIDNGIILYSLYPNATHIIQPADVSVFRPLKNSWKKTVNTWKLKTGNRCVTKALFAPLLEATFNAISKDVIRNGFRKCGLYPFDANAISYEKCMTDSSRHEKPDKPTAIGPEHLLYFESLMPSSRIREFRAAKGSSWTGDESAKELFYVWQKIFNTVNEDASRPDEQTSVENKEPEEQSREVSNDERESVPANNQPDSMNDIMILPVSRELPSQSFLDIPVASTSDAEPVSMHTPSRNIPTTPVKQVINTPSSSKQPVRPVISPAFATAVVWPSESPIKGKKKRNKVRLPDAVNSSEWMKYWKEKEDVKKEKEEKKALRIANRDNKENKQINQRKNKKQKPDSETSSDEDNLWRNSKRLKIYSDSEYSDEDDLPLINSKAVKKPKRGDYVIVEYEEAYFPGTVENVDGSLYEVSTMTFSAGNTFRWPDQCDKIWYDQKSIKEIIRVPVLTNNRGFYKVLEMDKFMPKI